MVVVLLALGRAPLLPMLTHDSITHRSPSLHPCVPFSPAPEPADPVDPRCPNTVQDFLQELVLKGEPYASTVRDVLQSFIKE